MKIAAGTRIGRYVIRSPIGAGGMGHVYLAEDVQLRRKAALKFLAEELLSEKDHHDRFLREARAASALNHPNICTIYEISEEGDAPFIAMEFIEGDNLAELIRRRRRTPRQAVEIAIDAASALADAHAAGIVHRDIKPANLIVTKRGRVKVLDFGLAKQTEAAGAGQFLTQAGMILGTASYMSPEQARGLDTDARSDLWSLGVCVYEMLTARQAFTGETQSDTLAAVLTSELDRPSKYFPEIPSDLEQIIFKALRKGRDERYQSADEMLTDLRAVRRRMESEEQFRQPDSGDVANEPTHIFANATTAFAFRGPTGQEDATRQMPPSNLSRFYRPIVGRSRESEELAAMLRADEPRLVTMTGVGGTGKTRLAAAVAEKVLPAFEDGVFVIELASITQPDLVAEAVAKPFGVKDEGGMPVLEQIKSHLADRHALIVLDNFEQVVEAAPIVGDLLAATQKLKILITSRVLLQIQAETEYPVGPLAPPQVGDSIDLAELESNESVALFVERARAARRGFELTEDNAADVAAVCARLEGLPLAIELAAARIRVLSPAAINTKLRSSMRLLSSSARDLPERQRTIHGAVGWSYDLLSAEEKRIFTRLGVFAGGFTIEAADAVAGDGAAESVDVIESLCNQSLLGRRDRDEEESRFHMLEVVKDFAVGELDAAGETGEVRDRHAQHFLALAEEAEPHLQASRSADWFDRLENDHDNLRAAMEWLLAHDTEAAARLAAALRNFWLLHSHLGEGYRWLKAALESGVEPPAALRFKLMNGLGLASRFRGDLETARRAYEAGLAAGEEAGDKKGIAVASRGLGLVAMQQGDLAASEKYFASGLAISRELEDRFGVALSLSFLGDLNRTQGKYAEARPLFEEALGLLRELDNKSAVADALNNLAAACFSVGDLNAAKENFGEALEIARSLGNKMTISYSLDGFAALAVEAGENEHAARLSGAAEALRQSIGYKIEPAERRFREAYFEKLRGRLDPSDLEDGFEHGRTMSTDAAIEEAVGGVGDNVDTGDVAVEETRAFKLAETSPTKVAADVVEKSPADPGRSWLWIALAVLLGAAAVAAGFWLIGPSRSARIGSIAVMPFANETGDPDMEYLSDGMTETLISSLSELPNLTVKARSSVFRFKGKEADAKAIGSQLGVQAVLNGRVVKHADELTLYLELVDAATGNRIWGTQYNRKLTDLIALQGEIARDVSQKLKTRLSTAEEQRLAKNYTSNVEAYQLYLRGRYHLFKLTPAGIQTGASYFQQAIENDPSYALAYVGLASAYRATVLSTDMPPAEFFPKGKAAAQRAIEIDDNLAEAHAVLAFTMFWYDWDWPASEREFKRAIELDPNSADAHWGYGHMLSNTGRHQEALAEMKLAREIDPLSLIISASEGLYFIDAGQPDEGLKRLQKTSELDPNYWFAHLHASSAYCDKGLYDQAAAEARRSHELNPGTSMPTAYLGYALAKSGREPEARSVLDELLRSADQRYMPPYHVAIVYNGLGDRAQTLAWLDRGVEMRDPKMTFLKVDKKWDNLRGDSAFQEILKKVGFVP